MPTIATGKGSGVLAVEEEFGEMADSGCSARTKRL
jgi:hypothetical protein